MRLLIVCLGLLCHLSCDFGPKTETLKSRSKEEAIDKQRYLGEYTPNVRTLYLCGKLYKIQNIWLEKYRVDLDFYNYILDMELNFNLDNDFKILDSSFRKGYSQSRINLSNEKILQNDFSIEFINKNDRNCRDTITFRRNF